LAILFRIIGLSVFRASFSSYCAGFYLALAALLLHVGSVCSAGYRVLSKKPEAKDNADWTPKSTDSEKAEFQAADLQV